MIVRKCAETMCGMLYVYVKKMTAQLICCYCDICGMQYLQSQIHELMLIGSDRRLQKCKLVFVPNEISNPSTLHRLTRGDHGKGSNVTKKRSGVGGCGIFLRLGRRESVAWYTRCANGISA